MRISEIILSLGGAAVVARHIGLPAGDVGPKRVRAWALRNSIPAEYWAALTAYSERSGKGVTLEVLATAHDTRSIAEVSA